MYTYTRRCGRRRNIGDIFDAYHVFLRFKTRRRFNLCATESLCYQIYLDSEQFIYGLISRNIVDHVSVLVIAAYLLSQRYYMC